MLFICFQFQEFQLEENEERSMIEPRSFEKPDLQELIRVLIEWINDELHHFRIIVQDIEEDLYDGQILQKLMEKLTGETLHVPEVTQSEEGQRNKLRVVLSFANRVLGLAKGQAKWSVDSVHTKNIVSILHLLVALARLVSLSSFECLYALFLSALKAIRWDNIIGYIFCEFSESLNRERKYVLPGASCETNLVN